MSDFFEDFLRDGQKEAGAKPRAPVSFAFMGKYPAWDDFFSEGDQSRSLATLFRLLRSGVQEAKSAEAAGVAKVDPLAINHLFLWHRGGQALIGSVWASHDSSASGERRFPAAACIHSTGGSSAAAIDAGFVLVNDFREVASALPAHLGYKSREERSQLQERIRTEIELARKRLPSAVGADSLTAGRLPQECASQLMAAPASGAHWDGVIQAMDGFRRRFAPLRASIRRPPGSESRLGTAVQRFPDLFGDSLKTVLFWRALLAGQLDSDIPLLWIAPRSGGWVDLVAGEPSPKLWAAFCIPGAGPQGLDERSDASPPPDWLRPRIGEAVQALSMGGVAPSLFEASQSQDRTPSTVVVSPTKPRETPPVAPPSPPVQRKESAPEPRPQRGNLPASSAKSNRGLWIGIGALASLAGALFFTKDIVFPKGQKEEARSGTSSTGAVVVVRQSAPEIIRQPVSTTISSGEKATLAVETRAPGPYAYAWEYQGTPGRWVGTNRELVLPTTSAQAGGKFRYRCIVYGVGGMTATSSWATLTVGPAPSVVAAIPNDQAKGGSGSEPLVSLPKIEGLPLSLEKTEGEALELVATVTGASPIRLAWFHSGRVLPESNLSRLTVPSTTKAHGGSYWLVASNKGGMATSGVVNVSVLRRKPDYELSKPKWVVGLNEVALLEVKARDASRIRWIRQGQVIGTNSSYSLAVHGTNDAGPYLVVVSNEDYSTTGRVDVVVTMPVATVSAGDAFELATNRHLRLGAPFALRAQSGEGAALQWFKGDGKMPVATGAEFRKSAADKGDTGVYQVRSGGNLVQTFRVWVERTNSIGMAFVWIPNLPSTDGTPPGGWVGKYEVTVGEWNKVMGLSNHRNETNELPVSGITFNDAKQFCTNLTVDENRSGRDQLPKVAYVLPTVSQWHSYSATNDIVGAVLGKTAKVYATNGPARANGLYNVIGNVAEFCEASATNTMIMGASFKTAPSFLLKTLSIDRARTYIPIPEWGFRCIMLGEQ